MMDMIFKRYSCPFLLLDQYISSCRLNEFIVEFIKTTNEEIMWDVWLHKVFDQSFADYKQNIENNASAAIKPTKKQLETTIKNSYSMLEGFVPD